MEAQFNQKLSVVAGKLFIDGHFVQSEGGSPFPVLDPSKEEVICECVAATVNDVEKAIRAARTAFDKGEWSSMSACDRGRLMYRVADLIDEHLPMLAHFETKNNGKPLSVSTAEDIPMAAKIWRYFAGQADKIKGSVLNVTKPFFCYTEKEPIGVCAQILPWNYPLLLLTWKLAPALAAGCTVVLKPAEQTPLTALLLGVLLNKAKIPKGVVNIVTGFGETGAALSQHRLIDKVSFTGSTDVGYLIMRNSHKYNLRPITLQLGGKSANIILPDADLDFAVEQACSIFSNAGQSCVAGSRTFVHESIYDKFVDAAVAFAKKIVVGDPFDAKTTQGPIVSKEQLDRILSYIDSGVKEGAKLLFGGTRIGEKGFFIVPAVFCGVQDNMKIAREQIFGPVMCILKWKDEDEVIERANQLQFGLGAGVVTNNLDKMLKFSKRLKAGTVYVNCYDYQEGSTPFGGFKDSGIGKDLGDEGLEGYLVTKTILVKPRI